MRFVERVPRRHRGRPGARAPPRQGRRAKGPGFLDDHAFVADAALDLYEATGEPRVGRLARVLGDSILAHFLDPADGGFFFAPDDGESILVRAKDPYDHAVPSGASIACRLLLRLGPLVDPKYGEPAQRAVEARRPAAARESAGMGVTVALIDRLVRGSAEVVLVGPRRQPARGRSRARCTASTVPNRVARLGRPGRSRVARGVRGRLARASAAQDEPVAYVCRGRTCSLPITQPRRSSRKGSLGRSECPRRRGAASRSRRRKSRRHGRARGMPVTTARTHSRAAAGRARGSAPAARSSASSTSSAGPMSSVRTKPAGTARGEARHIAMIRRTPSAIRRGIATRSMIGSRNSPHRRDLVASRRRRPRRAAPSGAPSRGRRRRAACPRALRHRVDGVHLAQKRSAPPAAVASSSSRNAASSGQQHRHRPDLPEQPHRTVRGAPAQQAQDLFEDPRPRGLREVLAVATIAS